MHTAGSDSLSGTTWPVVTAPPHWRVVEFISDLHLQACEPATFQVWQRYMASTQADAIFILGDLFEVWVGDDVMTAVDHPPPDFETRCQHTLASTSARLGLFFMHGNRDFLLGQTFAQSCAMTLLPDPSVLLFDQQRWLLSHGDALCLDDTDYQQFRAQVRTASWRKNFLEKPLAQRQALARGLREQSESRKASGVPYADVDSAAALAWLETAQATTLIHGHTHRAADHLLSGPAMLPRHRRVLSDWDAEANPPRLQVLRLRAGHAPARITLPSSL
jgi:UDP-2,3-diacylglucosamine hydrolase